MTHASQLVFENATDKWQPLRTCNHLRQIWNTEFNTAVTIDFKTCKWVQRLRNPMHVFPLAVEIINGDDAADECSSFSTFSDENLFCSARLEKPSSWKLMQGLLQWNSIQNSSVETQNKMFPCYFQALFCHKTQHFQFMSAHINIYALLEVFRYKTKTLLCCGKQIYISRTSYNQRQHKGSI